MTTLSAYAAHPPMKHAIWANLAVMLIGIFSPSAITHGATRRQLSQAAGIPTYFSFGIFDTGADGGAGYLSSMRANNATAWDFRYQYLSGGVNTTSNWSTWNSPPGQYAATYMQDSKNNGFTPAFVYYDMLQSQGPSGNGEMGNDLAHLADPGVMNAYFAN